MAVVVTVRSLLQQFGQLTWAEMLASTARPSPLHLGIALALTAISFAALASYDWLAARVVAPAAVPARVALLAGATANAVSNTLGFHALTGSLVRARIYLRCGLSAADSARIVSLSWGALGLGFAAMLATAQWLPAAGGPRTAHDVAIGAAIFIALAALLAWLSRSPRQLAAFGLRLPLPPARMAAAQMAIGAVESAAAIGALYVLLPPDLAPPFSTFAVGCIGSIALGLVAHAPGGVGVFEASITALLGGSGRADLLAALLAYRAVYNLLPFALSAATLAWLGRRRPRALSSTSGSG